MKIGGLSVEEVVADDSLSKAFNSWSIGSVSIAGLSRANPLTFPFRHTIVSLTQHIPPLPPMLSFYNNVSLCKAYTQYVKISENRVGSVFEIRSEIGSNLVRGTYNESNIR